MFAFLYIFFFKFYITLSKNGNYTLLPLSKQVKTKNFMLTEII